MSASPAREQLSDFGPAVAQLLVCLVDDSVLLLGPRSLLHLWVQVVVPALAALLADTPLQVLGYHRPALGSILLNQLYHLGCMCVFVCMGKRKRKDQRGEGRVLKKKRSE